MITADDPAKLKQQLHQEVIRMNYLHQLPLSRADYRSTHGRNQASILGVSSECSTSYVRDCY